MPLILPHNIRVQGHPAVPYLFRCLCSCGWSALANSEGAGHEAGLVHQNEQRDLIEFSHETILENPNGR